MGVVFDDSIMEMTHMFSVRRGIGWVAGTLASQPRLGLGWLALAGWVFLFGEVRTLQGYPCAAI